MSDRPGAPTCAATMLGLTKMPVPMPRLDGRNWGSHPVHPGGGARATEIRDIVTVGTNAHVTVNASESVALTTAASEVPIETQGPPVK
jgi:hypothetical protein